MQAVVDDLLTSYEKTGKGKTILMLHGWGDDQHSFNYVASELAKKFQVITLDLPGFGATQPPNEPWDLDNYSLFVSSFLKKTDTKELYCLIGHSNGGALAVRSLSLGVVTPQKLILLAASGVRDSGGGRRFILKIIAKIGNIATIWMPERYRQNLRKSLYGVARSDMLVVPQLADTFKRTVRQDVQTDASKITQPTLLIYGDHDRAVPLDIGKRFHSLIKGSKLEVLSAGHFIHQEKPAEALHLIEEFLK